MALLLARQSQKIPSLPKAIPSSSIEGRLRFSSRTFVKENGLVPEGLFFFQSRYDVSVDGIYQKMGLSAPSFVNPMQVQDYEHVVEGSKYRDQNF